MKLPQPSAEDIDAILPQTQCGLCTYKGCMPYAEALAKNAAEINLCPPGGVDGLFAIAELLNKNPVPFISDMEKKAKPPSVAIIREAECIGCTKCIQACPVDAILGTGKLMHTVIASECTGCELCIAPCPVDCIDMVELSVSDDQPSRANHYRTRYNAREARLKKSPAFSKPSEKTQKSDPKAYIQAALKRVQLKQTK
jgi:electron transport complex protein RnfB